MKSQRKWKIHYPLRKLRLIATYECYNQRRYGKPWGHRIAAWDTISDPSCDWGDTVPTAIGTACCSEGCEVYVVCSAGDVLVWGQRDKRYKMKSELNHGVLQEDGTITKMSKRDAFAFFHGNHNDECVIGTQDDCIAGMTKHLDDQIWKGKQ